MKKLSPNVAFGNLGRKCAPCPMPLTRAAVCQHHSGCYTRCKGHRCTDRAPSGIVLQLCRILCERSETLCIFGTLCEQAVILHSVMHLSITPYSDQCT